jgi:hypothetical protein
MSYGLKERKYSKKYKMGDISKGVANTLQPAKTIYKKKTNTATNVI